VIAALRQARNEVQLTQAIGAFAAADPLFAARLARLLVETAARQRGRPATNAERLLPRIPLECTCTTEKPVAGGRIDLHFEHSPGRFELAVEAKVDALLSPGQLDTYITDLEGRHGGSLIGLAVQVPPHAEPSRPSRRWLGFVRWDQLFPALDEGGPSDPALRELWRSFLKAIHEPGDLGSVRFDLTTVLADPRRQSARAHYRSALELTRAALLAQLRDALVRRPRANQPWEALADFHTPRSAKAVRLSGGIARVQFEVPRGTRDVGLEVEIGPPGLGVRYWPSLNVLGRTRRSELRLEQRFLRTGFEGDDGSLLKRHPLLALDDGDPASALARLAVADIHTVVRAGAFDPDIA
jgi:hypothetical protein